MLDTSDNAINHSIPVSRAEVYWRLYEVRDGTAQEIADAIGLARKTVQGHLLGLEKAGVVFSCHKPKRYKLSHTPPAEYQIQLQALKHLAQEARRRRSMNDPMLNVDFLSPSSEPIEPVTGSPGTGMTRAPLDPLIRRALAQVHYIGSIALNQGEQWQPNPLAEMNLAGMLRERTAVALSGDFDTAQDYAAAVFNSEGSVTFLFNISEAAQQVAWHLRAEWDGLNAVTLNIYDEAALATAANLAMIEYCCIGQACIIRTFWV